MLQGVEYFFATKAPPIMEISHLNYAAPMLPLAL
jgi:hypothetical protein